MEENVEVRDHRFVLSPRPRPLSTQPRRGRGVSELHPTAGPGISSVHLNSAMYFIEAPELEGDNHNFIHLPQQLRIGMNSYLLKKMKLKEIRQYDKFFLSICQLLLWDWLK